MQSLATEFKHLDATLPVRNGVSRTDIVRSYLGLLVQGKSDFDAIEGYRGDTFFKQSLGISLLPSSPTLRQRMDARASELFEHVPAFNERLLRSQRPDYGVLPCGWLPLDVDMPSRYPTTLNTTNRTSHASQVATVLDCVGIRTSLLPRSLVSGTPE